MNELMVPPHSVVDEQSVIGGILIDASDKNAFLDASGVLSASGDEFYREDHRLIWRAIVACEADDKPVDILVLNDYLTSIGKIDQAGGLSYLGTMAKNTPSAANIKAYAKNVKEHYMKRCLIAIGQEISGMGFNMSKSSKEILEYLEGEAFDLAERDLRGRKGFVVMGDLYKRVLQQMDEDKDRDPDSTLGHSTGFDEVDALCHGLVPGDLVIVAGRPSMGKTTFAQNIADFVSSDKTLADGKINKGKPVAVFSLEMPDVQLAQRNISANGPIDLNIVRSPWRIKNDNGECGRIGNGVRVSANRPLYIDDTPALSSREIRNRSRRLARKISKDYPDGLGAIVIDYIQLMREGRYENRASEVSEITRNLKALAKELNVPVVALSQLNRSLENRPDKRPIMSDLRESGAIEQDADVIMFIYRDVVYDDQTPEPERAEVIIAKVRNGRIGTAIIQSDLKHSRFVNYAPTFYQ